MKDKLDLLIKRMKRRERFSMLSGEDDGTKALSRLNIPKVRLADGAFGVSVPETRTTCFPAPALLACSFDEELVTEAGKRLANEAQHCGINLVKSACLCIKRSPLAGKNYEGFSEDPYLSGVLGARFIAGVQSGGVGFAAAGYACYNQETRKMTLDALVDRRTLHEIYVAAFERAIRDAKPWAVMCAPNKVNGEYCAQNRHLLLETLRGEIGYDGCVMSDVCGVTDPVKAVEASLDLELTDRKSTAELRRAYAKKTVPRQRFHKALRHSLELAQKCAEGVKPDYKCDFDANHDFVRQAAAESIVLLKNNDKILPLGSNENLAVIGGYAKNPVYQGGCNGAVNARRVENAYDEMIRYINPEKVVYSEGFSTDSDRINLRLIDECCRIAARADKVVVFAGSPYYQEMDGVDRTSLSLPENQVRVIEEVYKVNKNLVVVLSGGGCVEMPWSDLAKGILYTSLAGEAGGGAVADVLFGVVNPSGKLAESFPYKVEHSPSYVNFPEENSAARYMERFFVGYRYYDKKKIPIQFEFGYGLSYTKFEYRNIDVVPQTVGGQAVLSVSFELKNVGNTSGKEVAQVYVRALGGKVAMCEKQLKGFKKVYLKPNESKIVDFVLEKDAFTYYDEAENMFMNHYGTFEILIGQSSRRILLKKEVKISGPNADEVVFTRESLVKDLLSSEHSARYLRSLVRRLQAENRVSPNINFEDFENNLELIHLFNLPLRCLPHFAGFLSERQLDEHIAALNQQGHAYKSLMKRVIGKK